jgi:hypothetical protein
MPGQAFPGRDVDFERIEAMLVANNALLWHFLKNEDAMYRSYRTWWSFYGRIYVTSLPPACIGWERRGDAVRHYYAAQAQYALE